MKILDDTIIEPNEQFYLTLSSDNPQVTFDVGEAIITIVDDDGDNITAAVTTLEPSKLY